MEIVIATHNMHKVRELRAMLKSDLSIEFLSLNDFPSYVAPEETGSTFEENALIKASSAAHCFNKWVLADDSGLVVPSLNGEPGVFSARYAKVDRSQHTPTDRENRIKLLKALAGKSDLNRSAYFECCLALVSPNDEKKIFKGVCEGLITEEERGKNGFGYDAIFIKHDYNQTFAELDESIKNRISHRRKAVDKLILYLESL
ncbi:MAG: RdgB/HAM1 family non-canonical purine NTP pyrophosphatase [Chlamydiales bacterium]|nr:RdgB/HAM1 family non-canonical purine NTP pyrophosphatase [Chlamydiales bacterium]